MKKAEIENLHFHNMRHEAITRLARRSEILDFTQVTGHKNLNQLPTSYEAFGDEPAERLSVFTFSEEIK